MRRNAVLSFATCFFLAFVTMTKLTLNANASSDEYTYVVIDSGSMEPALEKGDIFTVKTNVTVSQIYTAPKGANPPGDIIAFYKPVYPSEIIVHRAVGNGTGISYYLITQGDANPGPDGWRVRESDIIGKVVAFSRNFNAGTWNELTYNVTVSTNSTLANFDFNEFSKEVTFETGGYMSRSDGGFCNVTIPKDLLRCDSLYDWQVLLTGTNIAYIPTQISTHTFIYFTYGDINQTVQIIGTEAIPEFPTWTSILLMFIVLTVCATLYKSRLLKCANTGRHR
jgi:signal peptidase I